MTNVKYQSARVLTCVSVLVTILAVNPVKASWCCGSEDDVLEDRVGLVQVFEEELDQIERGVQRVENIANDIIRSTSLSRSAKNTLRSLVTSIHNLLKR